MAFGMYVFASTLPPLRRHDMSTCTKKFVDNDFLGVLEYSNYMRFLVPVVSGPGG